jgi:glycerophosphoryl diester phosphodiesterase
MALGVEQVEFDVQRTADGVPVIFHDATLDRTTDGTGPLAERSLAELRGLTLKGGGRILSLAEGAAILAEGRVVLRCEVKPGPGLRPYPGLLDQTLEALEGLLPRTVLTSFHLPTCAEAARRDGLRDVLWLVADPVLRLTSPAHVARLATEAGIRSLAPALAQLDDAALDAFAAAGLRASAFAVLEDAEIERALRLRLPVFTTDRPDVALRLRGALAA